MVGKKGRGDEGREGKRLKEALFGGGGGMGGGMWVSVSVTRLLHGGKY